MNFGPLNKEGGWRRLNVAITRARREMLVFSSFDPSMIDLNRTNARAVRDLKHFLEFAQRGPRALGEAYKVRWVATTHRSRRPWRKGCGKKVGKSFPRLAYPVFVSTSVLSTRTGPGDYLAGVECDGATYHSAATARDRDKVRSAILQGLGWKLVRLWSTEWWVDKAGALQRLHEALDALLAHSRAEVPPMAPALPEVLPMLTFTTG